MWLRDQPRLFKCLLLIVAVFGALLCSRGQPALASCTGACAVFTFTATSSNTNGYITTIDDATINNQPNEVPLAAQGWPNNYDPHPIGVWYDPNTSHWTVFNEDLQAIPLGTSFSIFTGMPIDEPPYEAGFTTTATSGNSTGDFTLINNDVSNNNPQADVFVTQKWTGTYDPHEIGVWYDSSAGEWGIFNEDGTAIPAGSSFNVNVDNPNLVGSPPILQQATSANTSSYITYIDNPNLNGNPNLVLHATQVYNANGQCGCMYNNHQIGVWYNARNGRWSVYNVDRAPMPAGAEFFVLYGPPFN